LVKDADKKKPDVGSQTSEVSGSESGNGQQPGYLGRTDLKRVSRNDTDKFGKGFGRL
jgi:hypothetical protein